MKSIRYLVEAQQEMIAVQDWYGTQSATASRRFLVELKSSLIRIATFPEIYSLIQFDCRRGRVTHFPYSIIYQIELDYITVIALAADKREPRYWKHRLK